jgi:hypothetical protein
MSLAFFYFEVIFLGDAPKACKNNTAAATNLDNMHFDVNMPSLHYYGSLYLAQAPKKEVEKFLQTCAADKHLKRIPNLIKWGAVWHKGRVVLKIPILHFLATTFQIPAELLILEEKHFNKMGFAGYRIAFEAYRQGYTLEQLAVDPYSDPDSPRGRVYRLSWKTIISGNLTTFGYGNYLHRIFKVCHDALGIDIGTLVSKPVQDISKDSTTLSLTDMLASLNTKDTAMLIGMAKLMQDYKLHRRKTTFREGCNELIRWYQDGNKKK